VKIEEKSDGGSDREIRQDELQMLEECESVEIVKSEVIPSNDPLRPFVEVLHFRKEKNGVKNS